jgi:hypothetical protein
MKRTGLPLGTPALFLLILIAFMVSIFVADYAYAGNRSKPARRRDGGQRKPPASADNSVRREPAKPSPPRREPARPRREDPPRRVEERRDPPRNDRRDPPRNDDKRRDPNPVVGRKDRDDSDSFERGRRRIDKRDRRDEGKKKEKGPLGRDDYVHDPVVPVIGGGGCVPPRPPYPPPGVRPPWPRPYPRPPIIYNTYIYYYNYTYICLPALPLVDDEVYGVRLPFGPILPWEVGELFLIRLKYLEGEGLGGTMMTTIVQTRDEMGWEQFLGMYGDDLTDVIYYGPVGRTSFLVSMTVSDILDLMVLEGIRWVGEYYPEYKIVPGGRAAKFYVMSLEGDTVRFRRELRDAGVFVMGFDAETQEYYVRSSRDTYKAVSSLWWVARISASSGEPFFQPECEWVDVGMTR